MVEEAAEQEPILDLTRRLAALRQTLDEGSGMLLDEAIATLEGLAAQNESRQEARQLVAREEHRNRTLFELKILVQQIPAAVVVFDSRGRVELVNRQTEELLRAIGIDPNDFTTLGELELLRDDGTSYAPDERPLVRALEHGEEMSRQRVCVRLADAAMRMLEVSVAPLRTRAGRITGVVLVATNVSERERMERAEREFVSNAAHQLRNPLAAIRGAIEVLQAGAKEDPKARDRFLEHIERETGRLTRLARSLLLLARAQSHVEEPRREVVPLAPLLYDVASRLLPPAGVTVHVRCTPDLAAVANADLLQEALTSLADNAVRYTPRGRVLLACHRSDGSLTVEVRDEGPGIPAEVQASVFDRFYRGPGSRQGFGLGLAIAAQAADAIGAKLEIDSAPGKGTAVRVVVPAAKMLPK
jgi:PAS domain S-box-containing protein